MIGRQEKRAGSAVCVNGRSPECARRKASTFPGPVIGEQRTQD
ncbi:hypothetical protein ebA1183 [Aromatoleum aromaticum EbN1]|uniref:Uncharacterized protein n=1 Tax=Aromatoleum aromaticum (strain DSM 19018 / LMG 30748 / EbN1) TaxID=76114 RepID=Q5P7G3_AROAE|nr:hypothetical protein ebA1183 [Aromatoleum aromaticum EbN1]